MPFDAEISNDGVFVWVIFRYKSEETTASFQTLFDSKTKEYLTSLLNFDNKKVFPIVSSGDATIEYSEGVFKLISSVRYPKISFSELCIPEKEFVRLVKDLLTIL